MDTKNIQMPTRIIFLMTRPKKKLNIFFLEKKKGGRVIESIKTTSVFICLSFLSDGKQFQTIAPKLILIQK